MPLAKRQSPYRTDVTSQRDLKRIAARHARAGQVENLDDPVGTPRGKECVGRVERN